MIVVEGIRRREEEGQKKECCDRRVDGRNNVICAMQTEFYVSFNSIYEMNICVYQMNNHLASSRHPGHQY